MSKYTGKQLSLAGINSDTPLSELKKLFHEILNSGIHGLCFSLYEDGQQPGDQIGEEQVRRRMEILSQYTNWIRSFSCTEGNEFIPKIAKEYGLKTLVGAWLGSDEEKNAAEMEGLKKMVDAGWVDIAAIGNEVMYREDLTEDQLLAYMYDFKNEYPDVQMGYVDAYYEFTNRPRITEACDVILSNCYPFWEGCHINYSLPYVKEMYHQAKDAGLGKKVIITETGWPSEGGGFEASRASEENFLRYFINTQQWCLKEGIEMFYFSSFDESWKTGDEGDVGAYWGLWDKKENLKY